MGLAAPSYHLLIGLASSSDSVSRMLPCFVFIYLRLSAFIGGSEIQSLPAVVFVAGAARLAYAAGGGSGGFVVFVAGGLGEVLGRFA